MAKTRVSIEWLSGCSGCELGIVDLHEKLLTVLEDLELVRMPILVDTKEYVPADVGLVTGSIRTEHDVHAAHAMRKSCKALVAFGTCPVYGGPHSSAYAHTPDELLDAAYRKNPSTVTTNVPDQDQVPRLLPRNRPLDSEVPVDLYLPGCPPHAAFIFDGLTALLKGTAPRLPRHNVCFDCRRVMTKTEVTTIRRATEGTFDPAVCFLSQGCLCFGSVTMNRCLAPCMKVGVPCFSCGGPSEAILLEPQKDVRSEMALRMSHLTEVPAAEVEREIERQAKTHFAYAMASPVFQTKPAFLLKKWTTSPQRGGCP